MLPANLISTLKALALTDKPLITATPDKNAANAGKQFELGQKVQGTVQAQVAPNVFNVRVANQLLQMQLPAFIRSGDIITLQVVSLQPRLTFTLAASSNPGLHPGVAQRHFAPAFFAIAAAAGKKLCAPASKVPRCGPASRRCPIRRNSPANLHDALSHSGLFYESHQAQWIAGTRPTDTVAAGAAKPIAPQRHSALHKTPMQKSDTANSATAVRPNGANGTEQRLRHPTSRNTCRHWYSNNWVHWKRIRCCGKDRYGKVRRCAGK